MVLFVYRLETVHLREGVRGGGGQGVSKWGCIERERLFMEGKWCIFLKIFSSQKKGLFSYSIHHWTKPTFVHIFLAFSPWLVCSHKY